MLRKLGALACRIPSRPGPRRQGRHIKLIPAGSMSSRRPERTTGRGCLAVFGLPGLPARRDQMITKFSTVYAGHVDLGDMGQTATPANERRYSNEHLASANRELFEEQVDVLMKAFH